MACGFGLRAVRTLSALRSSFASSSAGRRGPKDADMTESACGADGERTTMSFTTRESLHEYVLEGAMHGDNEESDSGDEESSSGSESLEMARRSSRTLSTKELPHPLELLDPQSAASYIQSLVSADGDLSDIDSEEEDHLAEESDAEEMYSGPLQPQRTKARLDFPAPSEYLTRQELLSLVEGFN
eukprot:TRINITY_DN5092_c1_g6_i1.p1 TRINITY_DN5092_c1_g6~~TRINITY_DN5092_c1_g6_i1.p1  ORF type:complete len:185 (-),score=34.13 TRINITY_DN5092_c1_g6_i1:75-629(-)